MADEDRNGRKTLPSPIQVGWKGRERTTLGDQKGQGVGYLFNRTLSHANSPSDMNKVLGALLSKIEADHGISHIDSLSSHTSSFGECEDPLLPFLFGCGVRPRSSKILEWYSEGARTGNDPHGMRFVDMCLLFEDVSRAKIFADEQGVSVDYLDVFIQFIETGGRSCLSQLMMDCRNKVWQDSYASRQTENLTKDAYRHLQSAGQISARLGRFYGARNTRTRVEVVCEMLSAGYEWDAYVLLRLFCAPFRNVDKLSNIIISSCVADNPYIAMISSVAQKSRNDAHELYSSVRYEFFRTIHPLNAYRLMKLDIKLIEDMYHDATDLIDHRIRCADELKTLILRTMVDYDTRQAKDMLLDVMEFIPTIGGRELLCDYFPNRQKVLFVPAVQKLCDVVDVVFHLADIRPQDVYKDYENSAKGLVGSVLAEWLKCDPDGFGNVSDDSTSHKRGLTDCYKCLLSLVPYTSVSRQDLLQFSLYLTSLFARLPYVEAVSRSLEEIAQSSPFAVNDPSERRLLISRLKKKLLSSSHDDEVVKHMTSKLASFLLVSPMVSPSGKGCEQDAPVKQHNAGQPHAQLTAGGTVHRKESGPQKEQKGAHLSHIKHTAEVVVQEDISISVSERVLREGSTKERSVVVRKRHTSITTEDLVSTDPVPRPRMGSASGGFSRRLVNPAVKYDDACSKNTVSGSSSMEKKGSNGSGILRSGGVLDGMTGNAVEGVIIDTCMEVAEKIALNSDSSLSLIDGSRPRAQDCCQVLEDLKDVASRSMQDMDEIRKPMADVKSISHSGQPPIALGAADISNGAGMSNSINGSPTELSNSSSDNIETLPKANPFGPNVASSNNCNFSSEHDGGTRYSDVGTRTGRNYNRGREGGRGRGSYSRQDSGASFHNDGMSGRGSSRGQSSNRRGRGAGRGSRGDRESRGGGVPSY